MPDDLLGDQGRLQQILVNLINNAIKFTEKGEVVVTILKESQTLDDMCLHFTVRDTGIGIPEEKQKLLFQSFTQADASVTRKYGGTGLGLAISAQLVEMMKGRIWVESQVGQGSTFHFTAHFDLPSAGVVPAKPKCTSAQLVNTPVLIVDDNATNRQILQEILGNWGMLPVLAADGLAALAALERAAARGTPFPLAILDRHMPQMDGFDLAERIRANPTLAGVQFMMLTSGGHGGEAPRRKELGIDFYLMKPAIAADLREAIQKSLHLATEEKRSIQSTTAPTESHHLRILLAEDNPINQKLAFRLLEKEGHKITTANTGKEALAQLDHEKFDLVLMDVQMPEMGGLEAVKHIRENEKRTGEHMPVIALTAYAMKGDREICLESGMDGYLSKPIQTDDLRRAVSEIVPAAPPPASENGEDRLRQPDEHEPAWDYQAALGLAGDDKSLLKELAAMFLNDTPVTMQEAHDALNTGDAPQLERAAHRLKGSTCSFAANPSHEAAAKLQDLAKAGNVAEAHEAYNELQRQIIRFTRVLEDFTREECPAESHQRGCIPQPLVA